MNAPVVDNEVKNTQPGTANPQSMQSAPEEKKGSPSLQYVPITGRFDQYRSSFWAAAIAVLGVRYGPRPFLRASWDSKKPEDFYKKQSYSAFAGAAMEAVTGFFAYRTWKDMRNIFAEALAWEFDKDPKDVGMVDFLKSKNTMVQQTLGNYIRYNVRRIGINTAFFLPLVAGTLLKKVPGLNKLIKEGSRWHPDQWHPESGADMGLAANALYLFSDVISRRITPFESLQTAIDLKIHHAEHVGDQMTASDLLDIYERHAAKGTIGSFRDHRGTPEWDRSLLIFNRMAELMNQTYGNTENKEKSDFGIPKFIYLVGHNLIQPKNVEQTLAYIEIANRYDVPALKQVIKNGAPLSEILKQYPVKIPELQNSVVENQSGKKFAEGLPHNSRMPSAILAEKHDKNFTGRCCDKAVPPNGLV